MVKKTQRGFSLLELLIVISIVLVIAAMATPSVLNTVRRYQLESAARNVSSVLMRARYESIRLNRRVNTIYFVDPIGNDPPVYGVDEGGPFTTVPDGVLQDTEPQVPLSMAAQMVGPGPGVPPFATMGPNYAALTVLAPPNYQISYGPIGTVIYQPTAGAGNPWIESNTVYVILLQHNITQQWAAITVTPAGRVRVWIWNGSAWA
jgi:prepilin-type N-terminal cleavage/methylation domain-containing protein